MFHGVDLSLQGSVQIVYAWQRRCQSHHTPTDNDECLFSIHANLHPQLVFFWAHEKASSTVRNPIYFFGSSK